MCAQASKGGLHDKAPHYRAWPMKTQHDSRPRCLRSVSAKATYSTAARKKFVECRTKLDGVNAEIRHAAATGSLDANDKLLFRQRAMESRLAAVELRLRALQKSSEEDWEGFRDELEDAWEDLGHAITQLVVQVKDRSR